MLITGWINPVRSLFTGQDFYLIRREIQLPLDHAGAALQSLGSSIIPTILLVG